MSASSRTLGVCPDCETPIPEFRLLIAYERDGEPAAYADCPGCSGVVHPA